MALTQLETWQARRDLLLAQKRVIDLNYILQADMLNSRLEVAEARVAEIAESSDTAIVAPVLRG